MPKRSAPLGALALVLWSAHAAQAGEVPVDAEFLEFLGSLDSDDGSWVEFLAAIDLKATKTSVPEQPQAKPANSDESAPPKPKVMESKDGHS